MRSLRAFFMYTCQMQNSGKFKKLKVLSWIFLPPEYSESSVGCQ